MNPAARCLPCDQYFGVGADLEYRPWPQRQMVCAQTAGSRLPCDVVELRLGCSGHSSFQWGGWGRGYDRAALLLSHLTRSRGSKVGSMISFADGTQFVSEQRKFRRSY